MRAFIAVDAPRISVPGRAGGESAPSHLTLRFFAELPTAEVPGVTDALQDVASVTAPFQLTFEGFGAFPDVRRPRVVFAEVAQGRAELMELSANLDQALQKRSILPESRPFAPHLTVLRVRGTRDLALALDLLSHRPSSELGRTRVNELQLKESQLDPRGAHHRVVASASLLTREEPG